MALKKIFSSVAGLLAVAGVGVVSQLVLIKLLSGQPSGNLVYIFATLEIFSALCICVSVIGGEFSFLNLLFKKRDRQERISSAIGYIFLTTLIFLVVCVPLLFFCFLFLWDYEFSVYPVFLIYGAASVLVLVASLMLRADGLFFWSGFLEKMPIFLLLMLSIISVFVSPGYNIYLAAFSSSLVSVVVIALLSFFSWRLVSKSTSIQSESYREHGVFGFFYDILPILKDSSAKKITATNILVFLYERGDQILVGFLLGPIAMAGYFVCYKVSFFVRFFSKMVNRVFYAYVSKLINSTSEQNKNVRDADAVRLVSVNLNVNSVVSFVFALVLFFYSEKVLGFLNMEGVEYVWVLKVLAFSLYLSSMNQVFFNYINAKAAGELYFNNALIVTLMQFILLFLLVPFFGVLGVALAKLGSVVCGNVNAVRYMRLVGGPYSCGFVYPFFGFMLLFILVLQWVRL